MFNRIIIAEDFQDTSKGISEALQNKLHITIIQEESYCDKTYNRVKVAHHKLEPYELLITDLNFKESYVDRKLTSGKELIEAVRRVDPNIKVIVNSMIDDPLLINALFKEQKIQGYVCKGRNGLTELINALHEVYQNRTYVSPQINLNNTNSIVELDEFDLMILKELADGLTKKEVSEKFKGENIKPNSESTIDKKVSRMFDVFGAKNTQNLIAKLARKGKI